MFGRNSSTDSGENAGKKAEKLAARFLRRQGLRIRATNYRTPKGEIDLIAQQGDTLVFTEVRLRSDVRFGNAAESIDSRKQQRILYASAHYLQTEQLGDSHPCRFDAICLTPNTGGDDYDLEWIRDAFRPGD